jgi:hypothetical protein
MGSGLIFPNITRWGVLLQDYTLPFLNQVITVSNIPLGFSYLKVFLYIRSNQGPGDFMDYTIKCSTGAASYDTLHYRVTPPNVIQCTAFTGELTGWRGPTIGDSTTLFTFEATIAQPTIMSTKQAHITGQSFGGYLYTADNQITLPVGEDFITTIILTAEDTGAGEKFGAGSKVTVYGLN